MPRSMQRPYHWMQQSGGYAWVQNILELWRNIYLFSLTSWSHPGTGSVSQTFCQFDWFHLIFNVNLPYNLEIAQSQVLPKSSKSKTKAQLFIMKQSQPATVKNDLRPRTLVNHSNLAKPPRWACPAFERSGSPEPRRERGNRNITRN